MNSRIRRTNPQRSVGVVGLIVLAGLIGLGGPDARAQAGTAGGNDVFLPLIARGIAAPTLKWQRGGCYTSWCETGWYSSPAVAQLDGDPQMEVVGAAYSVFAVDGATGALQWRTSPNGSRAWPGVIVADLEPDGDLEIVTAHGGGFWHILNPNGTIALTVTVPPGNELRTLAAFDVDADSDLEILVASTASQNQWTVYDHNGVVRTGWPRLPNAGPGYAAGAFNQNVAVANLDGDPQAEIIGPSDVHYITAYQHDGAQIAANAIYGANKFWSQVGVHVSHDVDLRGYANCGREHRPNFAHSAPVIADLNGDGSREIVVVGNVHNCGTNPYTDLYLTPFVFNADRTRWAASGFNWTVVPLPVGGAALTQDYNVIESAYPNPALADLDGDGYLEILYASYDGRVHAYWLDKTQHGNWPFEVNQPGEGFYRFASEPTVADLDNDGKAEVIFASWVQKGTSQSGRLHIVSHAGNLLWEVALPAAHGGNWNGALAAPTLANIDGDSDLEVVLNTAHSGLVAYDLPGTPNAVILWGTGRGSYLRSGSK